MRNSFILLLVLFLVSCNTTTERMSAYEVHGIDISHYQALVDWDQIAAQDIHFAFVKATEGETLMDNRYCFNWQEMQRVGIKRGAYHFFRPTVSVAAQVDNFIEQVTLSPGDLPPVLDIEVTDGLSTEELVEVVKDWLLLVEVHYKIRPIIYSNNNFYQRHLAAAFPDYPIWIARYGYFYPALGNDRQWDFWQYGSQGELEGIEGDVDFNVFRGTLEELHQLCIPEENYLGLVNRRKKQQLNLFPVLF